MEDDILEKQHHRTFLDTNQKSSSDKIIEEILLNENLKIKTRHLIGQSEDGESSDELENGTSNPSDVKKRNRTSISLTCQKETKKADEVSLVESNSNQTLEIGEAFGVNQDSQNSEEHNPLPDEMTFQVIETENIVQDIDPESSNIQLVNDDLEDGSQQVVLDTHSSDLTDIDELAYTDNSNVLIPKFVVEDNDEIRLPETSSTVQVGEEPIRFTETPNTVTVGEETIETLNNIQGVDCLVTQAVAPASVEVAPVPVATVPAINQAIVGVAELDGNIVSIGGQHFILFTGLNPAGTVLEPRLSTTVVTQPEQNVLEETDEPPSKKVKIDEAHSSSLSDSCIENLVGFHSPQPHVVEVVEEDKTEEEKEEPVDITKAWFTSRDDKYKLQSKGSTWKQGQWSKDEVDILQANIVQYCKDHRIGDPTEVIFEMSKDERKNFYRIIAQGLNRPLFSVYRRVIRMYDQKNHIGKYTPEEVEKLRELRKRLGTDWAAIGLELGRSASSVKDRCRVMKDQCYTGKWLPEEEKKLANAVFRLSGSMPGMDVTAGLSWAAVAEQVGTRNEKQCRTKWLNYLNWKQRGGTEWTREDDVKLVERVSALNVTDETHINWEQLAKDWTSVRSPQWLRGKWWSLKRLVPDYQIMPFLKLVENMQDNAKNFLRGTGRSQNPYAVKIDPSPASVQQNQNCDSLQRSNFVPSSETSGSGESSSDQSQYIVTSQPCYEISMPLSVRLSTDEEGRTVISQTEPSGQTSTHFIESNNEQKLSAMSEEQTSVIHTYSSEGSASPGVVLAYPEGEDPSKVSVSLQLQQQNPMMSSAVKNDD